MNIAYAAILAGGQSTRMGADKALLPFPPASSMLEHIARTAASVFPNILVIGRAIQPAHWPADLPATFLADRAGLSPGPIAGLLTALEHCGSPLLLLACDLPLIRPKVLRALVAAHTSALASMALSPTPDGQLMPEPMLAIYTPAILPMLQEHLATGRRSLYPLAQHPGVANWRIPDEFLPDLLNVNDPATLAEAQRIQAMRNAEP